jgi:hypothetical protein
MMAGLLIYVLPSKEYGGAFLLLGLFFELVGLKAMFARKTK